MSDDAIVSHSLSDCEWNPWLNRPAQHGDGFHGYATQIVGAKGDWMLCDSCAALPRFKQYRKRKPIKP